MAQLERFISVQKLDQHRSWLADFLEGQTYPITLEVDPTNKCPLDCGYCIWHEYRGSAAARARLSPEMLLSIVSQAAELGVKSLIWTGGGEPLSNAGTVPAIELAAQLGLKNGMFTTGVPMTESIAEKLIRYVSWVRFHLDGATPESYAKLHNVQPSVFEKVVKNIQFITALKKRHASKIALGMGTVATADNLTELDQLARLAKSLGLDYFQYKHDLTQMSKQSYLDWWKTEVVPRLHTLSEELADATFTLQFSEGVDYSAHDKTPECHVHRLNTAITASGKVVFCKSMRDREDMLLGDIHTQTLQEIFTGEQYKKLKVLVNPRNCGVLPCPYKAANISLEQLKNAGTLEVLGEPVQPSEHWEFI